MLLRQRTRRLSDAQFRGEWFRRITSTQWRTTFRPAALRYYGYRCAVCGKDYLARGIRPQELQVDHRYYWKGDKLIFWRETVDDVRVVCPTHHGKGVRSDFTVAEDRRAYRWAKAPYWAILLPLRIIRRAASAWRRG